MALSLSAKHGFVGIDIILENDDSCPCCDAGELRTLPHPSFTHDPSRNQCTSGPGLGCGMAMSHVPAGESPVQITASHGSGIEPCRHIGNGALDA